jgi:GNAT superfamily N-acetyltransferase
MSGTVIRLATEEDASEMARLLSDLGHPTTSFEINQKWREWTAAGNKTYVADDGNGALLGVITLHTMLVLHRAKPVGRITALIVDVMRRTTGLGRALVAQAESDFLAANCGLIEVTSHVRLEQAHAFYEHLAYQRVSHRFAKEL